MQKHRLALLVAMGLASVGCGKTTLEESAAHRAQAEEIGKKLVAKLGIDVSGSKIHFSKDKVKVESANGKQEVVETSALGKTINLDVAEFLNTLSTTENDEALMVLGGHVTCVEVTCPDGTIKKKPALWCGGC